MILPQLYISVYVKRIEPISKTLDLGDNVEDDTIDQFRCKMRVYRKSMYLSEKESLLLCKQKH